MIVSDVPASVAGVFTRSTVVGAPVELSRERVRQIESRALNRLRRSHKTRTLVGYLN